MNKAQQQQYYELLREFPVLPVCIEGALFPYEDASWSRRERMERLTGRKVFYAPDGNEIRPGEADPCPCGLGRPYGECCGRRYRRAGEAPGGRGRSSE